MNTEIIKNHIYNDTNEKAIEFISSINDEETLYIYSNNYNWDNGFQIPTAIINNSACTLSVALLIFHLADGITYLESKEENSNLPEWSLFIKELYNKIINNSFSKGTVHFSAELSKVQEYKIKKLLSDEELIFITDIPGTDCNILL